jgi:hypothetical protein
LFITVPLLPGVSTLLAHQIESLSDVAWRRLVYLQNPVATTDAPDVVAGPAEEPVATVTPAGPVTPEVFPSRDVLHSRLSWIHREVQAITGDEAPQLVAQFIVDTMGTVASVDVSNTGAVAKIRAKLQPFLAQHVTTFLRELRAVCATDLPLRTYDERAKQEVQYAVTWEC